MPDTRPSRPPFILNWQDVFDPKPHHYPGSDEPTVECADLGEPAGLTMLGVRVDVLRPGRRSSWPHAEADEDEFVFVLKGTPDAWVDGTLHRLAPGDFTGFAKGTGIAHTIINNSDEDVHLLVSGQKSNGTERIHYPHHPARNKEIGKQHWTDAPTHAQGPHDGKPDKKEN